MGKFISRKQLEIQHPKTYSLRSKLKELGCEWDGIARAWIAPSLEVKELCYQLLEEAEESDTSPKRPYFGNCGWDDVDYDELEKIIDTTTKTSHSTPLPTLKPVAHTPTKEEAIKIVGDGNVVRYWREESAAEAAEILASGEQNDNAIYDRLENSGWKPRQISLVLDIVQHFRQYPPQFVADEVSDELPLPSAEAVDPVEMSGSISVISDRDGNPIKLAIKFPYDADLVNRIRWFSGRRWNPKKEQWELPFDSCHGSQSIFKEFPHFTRSAKAKEIEEGK